MPLSFYPLFILFLFLLFGYTVQQVGSLFPDQGFPSGFDAKEAACTVGLPAMWETRVRSLGQEDPLE